MSISGSGIGSGIDIRGLVDDLLKVEGEAKTNKFNADEADALAKITGLGSLKSAMSEFQSALASLKTISSFQPRTATSADTDVFTAFANNEASPANYSIEVTQLASNHKLASADFANSNTIIGTGDLKFSFGSTEFTITIGTENQTLAGIRDKINATSGTTGVQATIITTDSGSRLSLTSVDQGASEVFTVDVANDGDGNDGDNAGLSQLISANLTTVNTAVDSTVLIDGALVTTSSNTLDSVIDGVTIDLVATNIGNPIDLNVTLDQSAARAQVQAFVNSYNLVQDAISDLTKYEDGGFEASTGVLIGDALLRSAEISLRRELNSAISTIGGFRTVAEIGITTNEITGRLQLSNTKLTQALNRDFDAVGELFANSEDGIAVRMDLTLENFIKSNGLIESKIQTLNSEIQGINESRIQLERNLQSLESRLLSQFIAMDSLIAQLNQTSTFLTQQLDSLVEPLAFKK